MPEQTAKGTSNNEPIGENRKSVQIGFPKNPQPWQMTYDQFKNYVIGGKLHQSTGNQVPGEKEAETWLRRSLLNGYPEKDIAYFYSRRAEGYLWYLADSIHEGREVPEELIQKIHQEWLERGSDINDCACNVLGNWAVSRGILPPRKKRTTRIVQ